MAYFHMLKVEIVDRIYCGHNLLLKEIVLYFGIRFCILSVVCIYLHRKLLHQLGLFILLAISQNIVLLSIKAIWTLVYKTTAFRNGVGVTSDMRC